MNVQDPNEPFTPLQRIQTTQINDVLGIFSVELQNGDDDTIFGNVGRDVIVAGAGDDMADGDEQDDLIFGDNVTALLPEPARRQDITSLRFQTLYGGEIYTRTDRPLPAGYTGPAPTADDSGVLLADGIARDFRDPDTAPWWAEYTVDYASLHNFDIEDGLVRQGHVRQRLPRRRCPQRPRSSASSATTSSRVTAASSWRSPPHSMSVPLARPTAAWRSETGDSPTHTPERVISSAISI